MGDGVRKTCEEVLLKDNGQRGNTSSVCYCMAITAAVGKLGREDCKTGTRLGYTVSSRAASAMHQDYASMNYNQKVLLTQA